MDVLRLLRNTSDLGVPKESWQRPRLIFLPYLRVLLPDTQTSLYATESMAPALPLHHAYGQVVRFPNTVTQFCTSPINIQRRHTPFRSLQSMVGNSQQALFLVVKVNDHP